MVLPGTGAGVCLGWSQGPLLKPGFLLPVSESHSHCPHSQLSLLHRLSRGCGVSRTGLSQPAFRARIAPAQPEQLVNLDFLSWRQTSCSEINSPALPGAHHAHRLASPCRQLPLVVLCIEALFIDFPCCHSDSLIPSGPSSLCPAGNFFSLGPWNTSPLVWVGKLRHHEATHYNSSQTCLAALPHSAE